MPTARRQKLTQPRKRGLATADLVTCSLSSLSMCRCITSGDKLVQEVGRGGGLLEGSYITAITAMLTQTNLLPHNSLFSDNPQCSGHWRRAGGDLSQRFYGYGQPFIANCQNQNAKAKNASVKFSDGI